MARPFIACSLTAFKLPLNAIVYFYTIVSYWHIQLQCLCRTIASFPRYFLHCIYISECLFNIQAQAKSSGGLVALKVIKLEPGKSVTYYASLETRPQRKVVCHYQSVSDSVVCWAIHTLVLCCLVSCTYILLDIEKVMLVRLATQTSKKHTNKCVDGLTHYRIKVTKTSAHIHRH